MLWNKIDKKRFVSLSTHILDKNVLNKALYVTENTTNICYSLDISSADDDEWWCRCFASWWWHCESDQRYGITFSKIVIAVVTTVIWMALLPSNIYNNSNTNK